jgi:glucose/arabinose dehydrogenase
MTMRALAVLIVSALAISCARGGAELIPDEVGNDVQPKAVKPTDELIARLKAPPGFHINVFAKDLSEPRMMAAGADGAIYVTRRNPGDVVAMKDADGDGVAESVTSVAKLPSAHGIAIHEGKIYLANVQEVFVGDIKPDGSIGELKKLLDGLPKGGRHPNRTLGFGPDAMLYLTVGSTCNCCMEESRESASILRVEPQTGKREVWCDGLRNTLGFGWHPATKICWGMDHGSDWLGDEFPQEELNRLESGKNYGWPLLHERNVHSDKIRVPKDVSLEQWEARSTPMTIGYSAHAAPLQMVFYTGKSFPKEYQNDAFVAMHGSWNRKPPAGYEVVRIRFDPSGEPKEIVPFVSGWLIEGPSHFGRPCGLAIAKDGSLIVGDDTLGVIYRISYTVP